MAAESLPTDPGSLASFGKKKGLDPFRLLLILGAVALLASIGSYFFLSYYHQNNSVSAVETVSTYKSEAAGQFVFESQKYRNWLQKRATAREGAVYDGIIELLAIFAIESGAFEDGSSWGAKLYSSIASSLIRLSFIFVVCWRLWVIALLLAAVWSVINFQPYRGDDFLGQATIGRHFYSGINAGLNKLNSRGEIDTFHTGLACPLHVTEREVEESAIAQLLKAHNALNPTNSRLISHILAYPDCPAYVVAPEHDEKLRQFLKVPSLPEATLLMLEQLLDLHSLFVAGESNSSASAPGSDSPISSINTLPLVQDDKKKLSALEFSVRMRGYCERVLNEEMKEDLAKIHPAELATILLAVYAGKVIVYQRTGATWVQRSAMPQLSSRAVLHSVVPFPKDYNYSQRMRIRRALIFASRRSAFGPVNLPLDLTKRTQAARQWVELLLTDPFNASSASEEIELYGLTWRLQRRWSQRFFEWVAGLQEGTVDHETFATDAGMLFIPVTQIVGLWRAVVNEEQTRRVGYLAAAVHARQQMLELQRDGDSDETIIPIYERIHAPLSEEEVKTLSTIHGVPADVIRDWGAIRVVLNSYSWLGRRVGHMTIPESSVVFGVFKTEIALKGRNSLGLAGKKGLVPLRSSRLQDKWGKLWRTRFIAGETDAVASTVDQYQALLAGRRIDDLDLSAVEESSAVV